MYQLPESLLSGNEIDRYLINSTMLDTLVRNKDGSSTLYIRIKNPVPN